MRKSTMTVVLAAAFALTAGVASSQTPRQPAEAPGYGPGSGMMGGSGPRGGYGPGGGPGYGMGPGMMGGYGTGPGMMGGYGGGPGMLGGYGGGPGMMGGYGGGAGMMGGYGGGAGMMGYGPGMMGLGQLDLSDQQRVQVNRITDELRRKNWDILGKTQDEAARLRDLYGAEKFDRSAVAAAYKRLGELRQARIENTLEAREKVEAVLTPEQRTTLRRWQRDWDVQ